MTRGGRERAVSVQIGAVLLLAILVTALSLYQVNAVPDENRGVEIDHHREVQTQLVDLRNGIVDTPHRGSAGSHSLALGTGYPSRSFTVNPPPATGTVRTVGTNDANYSVELVNATPADDDAARAWNENGQRYDTGAIGYRPHYNEFTDAPAVVYENTVLYNEQGGSRVALTEQAVVDGTRITLVTIDGNYSQTGSGAAALDLSTVSASGNAIDLEAAGDGNVSLRVPTRLSVAAWERLLEGESAVLDVRLEAERDGFSVVEIVLDPDRTYELRMAKVGLGTDVDAENESYLTVVDEPEDVEANETTAVTLEVRDRYNNPVPNVRVNASVDGEGSVDRPNGTTNGDGRVTFEYAAPESVDEDRTDVIEASYAVDPGSTAVDETRPENVTVEVSVRAGDDGGGTGDGGAYELGLDVEGCDADADPCTISESTEAVDVTAYTTNDSYDGVFVDFSSRNATVASFGTDSYGTTGGDGNVTKRMTVGAEGETTIVASSTDDTARRNVSVVASNDSTGPTAAFTYEPGSPVVGETVEFNASRSDGEITTYEWDLTGDGTYGDASGEVVTHEFDTAGDHTVGLEVVDENGSVDTERKTVTVSEADPEIEVTSNVREVGKSGKYEFELNNTGTHDVTIEAVGINATTHADVIRVGHGEILTAGGTSVASSPIPIDSEEPSTATRVDLDENVTLTVGDPTVFQFDRFQTDTTGGDGADMTGEEVTMTIYLSEGSTVTLDLVPNG